MSAPAGLCISCNMPLKWCFAGEVMYVQCPRCPDLFGENVAQDLLLGGHESRHETETVEHG